MKIFMRENTRLDGNHISKGETVEVSKEHADFLILLGRAEKVKDIGVSIVNKGENLENITNREQDLKVARRKTKKD